MKNSMLRLIELPRLRTSSSAIASVRPFGLPHAHGADLELRNIRDRDQCARIVMLLAERSAASDKEQRRYQGELSSRPWHERRHRSATALDLHKVAIGDAEFVASRGCISQNGCRKLIHQSANSARLRSREKMRDDTSGRKNDWILFIRHLRLKGAIPQG